MTGSRFDSLEFDDEPQQRTARQEGFAQQETGTPTKDAAWYRKSGDAAFHSLQFEKALREYSRMLEENNALPWGWLGQVRALIEMGEFKEADVWAHKALELFPEEPNLLAANAVASVRMGKITMGMAQSDNAVKRNGVTAYVWLSRAEALLAAKKKHYEQCMEKALSDPANQTERAWMRWEVSRVLRRYGRRAQALQHATAAMELLGGEAGAWLELGFCQHAMGISRARESFESAVQLDPENEVAKKAFKRWRKPPLHQRLLNRLRMRG